MKNSKRSSSFIGIVLVVLIVMILLDTSVDIQVNYDEKLLHVTSPRLNMDIPHTDVASVELIAMPELGICLDGYEHEAYCTGVWKNDIWGEYDLCVIPALPQCVAVTLHSGRVMVFSCSTDAKTVQLFESYQTYLSK